MTVTTLAQRKFRSIRNETPSHLYSIGQAVRLKGGMGMLVKVNEMYQITGTLPPRGNSPQYRIRSEAERHERVAVEDSLELVDMSRLSDGATLIERTFRDGQGAETQQSQNPETEARKGSVKG